MPVSFARPAASTAAGIATDAELAAHVTSTTAAHGIADTSALLTSTTAAATYATKKLARVEASGQAPTVVSLMSCQPDEVASVASCTKAADTVNYKVGSQGLDLTMAGAVTATATLDPVGPTDPLLLPPPSAIGIWVFCPDATKVTSVTLTLCCDATCTAGNQWSRSATGLVDGWNLFRWPTTNSNFTNIGTVYRVQLAVVTSAATSVTVGHVFAECPSKAQVLLIQDGTYATFVSEGGVDDLRTLGVPITWAVAPTLLGTGSDKSTRLTEADLVDFAAAGDSISFHSYQGTPTTAMTAQQIIDDTLNSVRWLQQRGYAGRMWRAAWTQNAATNHASAQPYVLAYATPSSASAQTCWPPNDRWNIPRSDIAGRSTATMDSIFAALQLTHGLYVFYVHGIHTDGGNDTTPTEWAYFVSKLTDAIGEGWLECVTFEDLFARSGGKFTQTFADNVIEYADESGSLVRQSMI